MRVSDFDYCLPDELIAQEPLECRDASRLMVLHRQDGTIEHRTFRDLPEYLRPDDVCILNDTRVIKARLKGQKSTGGTIWVLLLRPQQPDVWEALVKPGRKAAVGTVLQFGDSLQGVILDRTEQGGRLIRLVSEEPLDKAIESAGEVPLPPYIKKRLLDEERYQTVYAGRPGSVAAPTAGLHFTQQILATLQSKGVSVGHITLHVGLGTFRPVSVDTVEQHTMHAEYYHVDESCAHIISGARRSGARVLAVGTTVARTLESVGTSSGEVRPGSGWTSVFIYPGYEWKVVDIMLTNFHLPKSTLLMMVSALAGRENILRAYEEAVAQRYRFFSFGDAMLIL